jgi:F0F1-type ATP synthase membrane subunit b/b'
VAELHQLADEVEQIRQRQEALERARADAARRKQREADLATLARDFDRAWAAADQQAQRGVASAYDEVRRAVVDLAEAYELHATREQFEQALQSFMTPHVRRTTLVKRLIDAGLWKRR